jgi:hypothetical protein
MTSHFETELDMKKRVFETEEALESIGFNLFKALNQKKNPK